MSLIWPHMLQVHRSKGKRSTDCVLVRWLAKRTSLNEPHNTGLYWVTRSIWHATVRTYLQLEPLKIFQQNSIPNHRVPYKVHTSSTAHTHTQAHITQNCLLRSLSKARQVRHTQESNILLFYTFTGNCFSLSGCVMNTCMQILWAHVLKHPF